MSQSISRPWFAKSAELIVSMLSGRFPHRHSMNSCKAVPTMASYKPDTILASRGLRLSDMTSSIETLVDMCHTSSTVLKLFTVLKSQTNCKEEFRCSRHSKP
jgi:hypothetical protein